jgi:diadenosine tetraphosphate (Ap4A) HIT family hydrolase
LEGTFRAKNKNAWNIAFDTHIHVIGRKVGEKEFGKGSFAKQILNVFFTSKLLGRLVLK